jgi:hypothetical protein
MHRTIAGHPAESYSFDKGRSWTLPQVPRYENGFELKNPRACPRIWKCKNGKYLFWYHNNGGWDYGRRNPAWISGGIERDGKIIWGQPEILLYEEEVNIRMSYPDLIEQDGKYWITETNKKDARCHLIPQDFLNKIWSQFDVNSLTGEGLKGEWKEDNLKPKSVLNVPTTSANEYARGFTFDFKLELDDLTAGQVIFSTKTSNGKSVVLQTGDYGSIEIILSDGAQTSKWNSDPGLIKAFGVHDIAVTVDNGPRIIQFIVNGNICNGRDFRQYGWTNYKSNIEDIDFNELVIERYRGRLKNLRIYNRPLMNTELIGNHRYN